MHLHWDQFEARSKRASLVEGMCREEFKKDIGIVSVLHQEEGGIGKSIPDAQDFPRPKRFPEGKARGKSRGSREILVEHGYNVTFNPQLTS